jgi:hypothetical protein
VADVQALGPNELFRLPQGGQTAKGAASAHE